MPIMAISRTFFRNPSIAILAPIFPKLENGVHYKRTSRHTVFMFNQIAFAKAAPSKIVAQVFLHTTSSSLGTRGSLAYIEVWMMVHINLV
jgi:hypothetical protein